MGYSCGRRYTKMQRPFAAFGRIVAIAFSKLRNTMICTISTAEATALGFRIIGHMLKSVQ